MHVILLTLDGPWGGAEVHTLGLSKTLLSRGHRTTVLCLSESAYHGYRTHSDSNVKVVMHVPSRPWKAMSLLDWMRLFFMHPCDVCILVKGWFEAGNTKLDVAARLSYSRYLTIEHLASDELPKKSSRRHFGFLPGLALWWYVAKMRRSRRAIGPRKVICVSDAVGHRLSKDCAFPRHKLVTVRNGIDSNRFRRDEDARVRCRELWGVPPNALVFGAVGRLTRMKGYDTALIAFQELIARLPDKDLRLVLVGNGDQEVQLRAQVERDLPRGRVLFLPFTDRPQDALSAFDIFIMPSRNEGLPLALLEAMACNCCPVATAVGGIGEVLTNQQLGWLVPPDSPSAFSEAMEKAASLTCEQRAQMGKHARRHVEVNFNAEVQFNAAAKVIEAASRL